jgi:metal-sulfur cluster biosynthetic enzyme
VSDAETTDATPGAEPATAEQPATPTGGVEAAGDGAGTAERATSEQILDALSAVYDPEIGLDIINLGLVYDHSFDAQGLLTIDMTLTSPYCPFGSIIQSQADAVCRSLPGVNDVRVNLVWSPPWDPRTMASEEAKLDLGIF